MKAKARNQAQPVPVQTGPALRLYRVKHPACPLKTIEAYSEEEAARIYRDECRLFVNRDLFVEVVEHGGSR